MAALTPAPAWPRAKFVTQTTNAIAAAPTINNPRWRSVTCMGRCLIGVSLAIGSVRPSRLAYPECRPEKRIRIAVRSTGGFARQ
ncbi:hypothetical protein MPRM_14520 [Mycobacterium parmense]|uniref:Uncharacterized protein n=1 Tax=Mycobacterium parmense TaxID=185642 RepID=A0A7I7YTU8_9MYCO|nr:hypothetical protein MPRM_14520 [Mycobacterium parmense]